MAKSLEPDFAKLRACAASPTTDESVSELRRYLRSKVNLLAERAARIVGEYQLTQLNDDLVRAYDRFLDDPVKSDPCCAAKNAIAEALRLTGHDDDSFFLSGVLYTQIEPSFAKSVDHAAQLRASCGLALVQLAHPKVMTLLVDLLNDPEETARAGAARAIGYARRSESELLLRMKALTGDSCAQVMGEVFAGLLSVAPENSTELVARFLEDADEAVRDEAAMALGESRRDDAVNALRTCWRNNREREFEHVLLTSLAISQHAEAVELLFSIVAADDMSSAVSAISALRHVRDQQRIRDRLAQQIQALARPPLEKAFRKEFCSSPTA